MPIVPSTFVPTVDQQVVQQPRQAATPVLPMENRAPSLEEQIGRAVQSGGVALMGEGSDLRANLTTTMNDALARNAETQFLTTATKVATDYTHKLGGDAIDGYSDAQQAIVKAKADAEAGLENDFQRRNFGFVADQHLANFGKLLADHQFQQKVKFSADASNDRSDSMVQQAANSYPDWQRPDGKYALYKHQAVTEALHGAALLGLPPASPQAQQMVKQKTTDLAQGIVTRMTDSEQWDEAQTYLSTAMNAGEIDERMAERLSNFVMEGHTSQKGKDAAEEEKQKVLGATDTAPQRVSLLPGSAITARVTDTMGSPQPGGRVHDGIDIAIPLGSKLQAPADGTVTKVWNDDKFGGGLSMEVTYPNGSVEGVAHLGTVNYQPGQKVTQGSIIALSGQSGNATGPSVHWSMRDPDGNWIDPRTASPAAKDTSAFTDPNMLEKAIAGVNGRQDLTQRAKDVAINQLRSDYGTAREIDNQKHAAAVKQATDWWFQNGQSIATLPASIKMQLSPEELDSFTQQAKAKNDVDLLANWIQHPEQLTVDAVKQAHAQGKLSDNGYLTALRGATALASDSGQNDPEKIRQVSVDHDQLTNILSLNGLPNLAEPKSADDKLQRIQLEEAVKSEIDSQQQRNNRQLTWQEKGKIARDLTIDKVYTSGTFSTNSGLKPVAITTPQEQNKATVWVGYEAVRMMDIPAQYALEARQDLQTHGLPATQANIAAWWIKQGRPSK